MVLSWVRIHHVGPTAQVLCPEIETSSTVAISQISCSYSVATPYLSLPHPLTPTLANPQFFFFGNLMFLILTMCPTHCMRVLVNIVGIYLMSHLVATFTILIFCHDFTPDSLCKMPMSMALNFPTWACVNAHDLHL
jgi:hypothetical protein